MKKIFKGIGNIIIACARWCWHVILAIMNWCRMVFTKITKVEIKDSIWDKFVQFVKFGLVGFSNTVISTGVYWIMIYLFKTNEYIGNAVGFVVSVLNSFFWNNAFVFKKDEGETRSPWLALIKTFISYGSTGLVLNSVLIKLWKIVGIDKFWFPIINLLITIPLNYIMNKFWAFRTKKK